MGIRRILPGGEVPEGEPRRYRTSDGYWVLRWKVGVRDYVEVLEHRLLTGIPPGPVHHENLHRDDNRPENLHPTANVSEHGRLHARLSRTEVVEAYRAGMTTIEIAKQMGTYSGNVSRILRDAGQAVRPKSASVLDQLDSAEIERRLRQGERVGTISGAMGCPRGVVDRYRKKLGIPPAPPGRPRARGRPAPLGTVDTPVYTAV